MILEYDTEANGVALHKKKWIVEILLVVLIIGLGSAIYVLIDGEASGRSGSDEEKTADEGMASSEQDHEEDKGQVSAIQEDSLIAAPEFELIDLDGEIVALSDLHGKVVIVNFWATWCPPCRAEMPLFQAAGEKYPEDLVILAVNSSETTEEIIGFSSQFSDSITFLVDLDTYVDELYQIRGLPTTFFVDPEGYLQAMHIGELTESLLATYLSRMGIE